MENKVIIKCDGVNVSTLFFSGNQIEVAILKKSNEQQN